jgi:hypothetical protein
MYRKDKILVTHLDDESQQIARMPKRGVNSNGASPYIPAGSGDIYFVNEKE